MDRCRTEGTELWILHQQQNETYIVVSKQVNKPWPYLMISLYTGQPGLVDLMCEVLCRNGQLAPSDAAVKY